MRITGFLLIMLLVRCAFAQEVLLVLQEPAGLRVGPAAHMPSMETLPVGATVLGIERSGGWYRVRVDHAVEGWVPVLSTRLAPLPETEQDQLSGLRLERILTVTPRLEDAASLAPVHPSSFELRQFADSARLAPGRRP